MKAETGAVAQAAPDPLSDWPSVVVIRDALEELRGEQRAGRPLGNVIGTIACFCDEFAEAFAIAHEALEKAEAHEARLERRRR